MDKKVNEVSITIDIDTKFYRNLDKSKLTFVAQGQSNEKRYAYKGTKEDIELGYATTVQELLGRKIEGKIEIIADGESLLSKDIKSKQTFSAKIPSGTQYLTIRVLSKTKTRALLELKKISFYKGSKTVNSIEKVNKIPDDFNEDSCTLTESDKTLFGKISNLKKLKNRYSYQKRDFLIDDKNFEAEIYSDPKANGALRRIIMDNGIVRREFVVASCGGVGMISYMNLANRKEFIRAVKPEAEVVINGKKYLVGGLEGQKRQGVILDHQIKSLKKSKKTATQLFTCYDFSISEIQKRFHWKRVRRSEKGSQWPPRGKTLTFHYKNEFLPVIVKVHYNLYDGHPLIGKWITVELSPEAKDTKN